MMVKKTTQLAMVALFGLSMAMPVAQAGVSVGGVVALSGLFGSKPKFLPVNQAFKVNASVSGETLTVRFTITPEHYIYQDKLSLALPDGVTASDWQFDRPSTMIDDPDFGRVSVFEQDVVATTRLMSERAVADEAVKLTWQGCAKAGLCYPPEQVRINVSLTPNATIKAHLGKDNKSENSPQKHAEKPTKTTLTMGDMSALDAIHETAGADNLSNSTTPTLNDGVATDKLSSASSLLTGANTNASSSADNLANNSANNLANHSVDILSADNSEQPLANSQSNTPTTAKSQTAYPLNHTANTVNQYGFGLDKNPILAMGLLFLAGIALAFTACVYPMIPIVANIVAKSHRPTAARGFVLTSAYGLGVATSYGLLGAVVAWFGQGLGLVGLLQNRWLLTAFALLFVLFALQMAGVVKLGLPAPIKQKLNQHSTLADRHLGRVWGSFVVGMLSALVVSPCVSAPMAGALAAVAASNNVALGFGALFALGLGLSLPLVLMGTLEGKIMPKAGAWMDKVKHFMALMLLAVGVALIDRAWVSSWVLVLWAVWFGLMAVFFWQLGKLWRAVGLVATLWTGVIVVGLGLGASDVWRPLHPLTDKTSQAQLPDITVTDLESLDVILKTTPKVLVDVSAEWCVECKIMERTLFANRPTAMADWQLIRLDITKTSDDSRAVLTRYNLFGPPALLYYQKGQLTQVQLGEVAYADFELALALK